MASSVVVKYAVTYQTHAVTAGEWDIIWTLYNKRSNDGTGVNHIDAIKFVREQYGLGLKEAKDICDAIGASTRRVDEVTGCVVRGV